MKGNLCDLGTYCLQGEPLLGGNQPVKRSASGNLRKAVIIANYSI